MPSKTKRKITSGDDELDTKLKQWLIWDRNKKTSNAIKDLILDEDFAKLKEIMMNRIHNSYEGYVGRVEAGYHAMNDLVVIQIAQGFVKYLETNESLKLKNAGVVVGYDMRRHSKRFAELVSTVIARKNYPVKSYNVVVPTFIVPYAVVKYSAAGGIMIASTSGDKDVNGMKIFNASGLLFCYPIDAELEDNIRNNMEPNPQSWNTKILTNAENIVNPLAAVLKAYLVMIYTAIPAEYREINKKSSNIFVYSAVQGVGFIYMVRALDIVNVQIIPVEEDKYPSPEFTPTDSPEFKANFTLTTATEVLNREKAKYIIATNNDCTRVGIAERDPKSGEVKFFNSDEIAILLAWWTYHIYQDKITGKGRLPELYMVGGLFDTKLVKFMGRTDGFYVKETFGGKWLGTTVKSLILQGKQVIFAYDGYGYIVNSTHYSKDGIQAGIYLTCLVNYLCHHKLTLISHLKGIYKQYGYYTGMKFYFLAESEESIESIYKKLKTSNSTQSFKYPKWMANGKYIIKYVRDYEEGLDTAEENRKTILPTDPDIRLISFTFENNMTGVVYHHKHTPLSLILHTSICGPAPSSRTQSTMKTLLTQMSCMFIEEFLVPSKNKLVMQGMEIPETDMDVTNTYPW